MNLRPEAPVGELLLVLLTRESLGGVPMAHINDASNTSENVRIDKWRYVKEAKVVQALVNCSLCACAGVITHGTGTLETSGAVARRAPMNFDLLHKGLILEGVDPHFQHSRTFSGKGWTGASPDSSGKVTSNIGNAESTNKTNLEQAKGIRSIAQTALGLCKVAALGDPSKPDQQHSMTECMSFMNKVGPRGCIFAVLSASDGHWNFAHMANGQLQFVDYQMDHPDLGGVPATGAHFQKALGQGDAPDGSIGLVLAFQAQDHFPNGPATP